MRILTGTAAVAVLAACVYTTGADDFIASADAETVSNGTDLSGVEFLDTSAGLTVIYTVADAYSIDVEVRRGDLETVRIEREGSTLEVGRTRKNGWNWDNNLDATVTISGPNLKGVEASSGSSAQVTGVMANDFLIDVSSGAAAEVSGRCETLTVDVSSGADVDADALLCEDGAVDASSGGSAEIYLTGHVDIDVSSGADVDVEGGARLRSADKSSGGSYSIRSAPL
ncbi:MAG: DUF2807 domain-containing protein [Hyphomonadaceae bacterium]|nr:DUF2807 domain-containing protein [Hyphomonadaceae bacterium]